MRKYLVAALLLTSIPAANADGYAVVDANGNQVGGVIVCDSSMCGDPTSLYSQLTLKPGERYVLQSKTDSTGNTTGIQPNENTKVSVDVATTTWTVETRQTVEITPDISVEGKVKRVFSPVTQPSPEPTPEPTPEPAPTDSTGSDTSTVTTNTDSTTIITSETEQVVESPEMFSEAWWAWLVAILRELFGLNN